MKIFIYVIYFPTSNRSNPYYVGIAKNLEERMFQHLRNKSLVGNTLNKYGDWIIKKLHTCKTYEEAFRLEIEEIRNFNSVAPNGYNQTHGGEGNDALRSEEAKEKMRQSHLGKHHTEETKEKFRKNKNFGGHYHTEEWKKEKSKQMQGNKNTKGKNLGKKNVAHRIDVKIKILQTRIRKLKKN